jgi:hypothetical protein
MESSRQSQSSLRRVTKCCAPGRSVGRRLQALACLLVAGIIAGGWSYFQRQRSEARRVAEETLASIADLKAGQIAGWMKERRADAEVALNKPQARQFLAEPDNIAVREELLQWLTTFRRLYDYSVVALLDERAAVRLAVPADGDELVHLSGLRHRAHTALARSATEKAAMNFALFLRP